MRTAMFSGCVGLAALLLSGAAASAQARFVSIGHGGQSGGFRPVAAAGEHMGHARGDRAAHRHGGGRSGVILRPSGYFPLERLDDGRRAVVVERDRRVAADDGTAGIRALFNGPLAAGATAAATYILMTQGPKAFGLEEDYRKAVGASPAPQRRAPPRRVSTGPKIIHIGGH